MVAEENWARLARRAGTDPEKLWSRVRELASAQPRPTTPEEIVQRVVDISVDTRRGAGTVSSHSGLAIPAVPIADVAGLEEHVVEGETVANQAALINESVLGKRHRQLRHRQRPALLRSRGGRPRPG